MLTDPLRPRAEPPKTPPPKTPPGGNGDSVDDDGRRRCEVVEFPGTAPGGAVEPTTARGRATTQQLVTVWVADATDTARAAFDGAAWRSRPPALRDMAARTGRAEWSGNWPVLRVLGQLYGYVVALPVAAAVRAVDWVISRPLRAATAVALAVLALHLLR